MEVLQNSGSFVMLYPQKLTSSALFEAGYALALGRPSLFFVRDEKDLPYLMQRLPEAFTHVSILDSREWRSYDDIARLVVRNADHWFRQASPAQLK
jgi:nucleoside 2-deoxyribosyltransferase